MLKNAKLSTKMFTMGAGIIAALIVLGAISTISNRSVESAIAHNALRAQQIDVVMEMSNANTALTLNAMDAIIDRESGQIDSDIKVAFSEYARYLRDNIGVLQDVADTDIERQRASIVQSHIEPLIQGVTVRLPELVSQYANPDADLVELEASFGEIDDVLDEHADAINEALAEIEASIQEEVEEADAAMLATLSRSSTMSTITILFAIVGIGIVFTFFARSVVKSLSMVIEGLNTGADQVASASSQVSSSSQQMAEGASEQASSLEEISSSLEEMTSMTRQNSDNAKQANTSSDDAKNAAEKGVKAMDRMSDAITRIKTSSDETAKIVKTIDEIAFQTNLLALNAAVEAARAGEAGMGFAVVAEEVRNLAQRSAEAAKNTSTLIEESQSNADNGVAVSREVADILVDISNASTKVSQLIAEVTAATEDQAQGISQVNTAISQMDQLTQSNAANAEESASASEEMSSQAQEMNDLVQTLVTLVGGSRNNTQTRSGRRPASAPITRQTMQSVAPSRSLAAAKTASSGPKPHAETVIPLDEEFDEF